MYKHQYTYKCISFCSLIMLDDAFCFVLFDMLDYFFVIFASLVLFSHIHQRHKKYVYNYVYLNISIV